MHALGQTLLLAGFSGILAFAVLGVSRSMPLALTLHAGAMVFAIAYSIKKAGSLNSWRNQRIKVMYSVHPAFVTAIGVVFGLVGVGVIFFGKPSSGANAMNHTEIVYFGMIFLSAGSGLSSIAMSDWIESKAKR